jgi:hypothetical protein
MKKTNRVEVETWERFLADMAEVFGIPRRQLDKLVFRSEPKIIKKDVPLSVVPKTQESSKVSVR